MLTRVKSSLAPFPVRLFMKIQLIRFLITFIALAAVIAHLLWPTLKIDIVTLTLLAIAVLPWLSSLFKSIELPGGLKVEYQDLEKIGERARESGLLDEEPEESTYIYTFQTVASTDPNLALAGLRIELERSLERLAESRNMTLRRSGLAGLLSQLNQRELINGRERELLLDLAGLLNAAVHGAEVDPPAAEWALDTGPRILDALQRRADAPEIRYEGIT